MSRCQQRPAPPAAQGQCPPQRPRRTRRYGQRGAAMIVAIAIFAILLAIALTFYSVSRTEFDTSTNVINSVRSDLQADGAIAQAIAHLNEDFIRNHSATSTDHSWRSYFNGAWAAGKPWLMQNGQAMHNKGLPAVNLHRIEKAIGDSLGDVNLQLIALFPDGRRERLFRGTTTRAWLFIPRLQNNDIVLYDRDVRIYRLVQNGNQIDGELLFDGVTDRINPALASAGRPERIGYFTPDPNGPGEPLQPHPFVTSDYYGTVLNPVNGNPAFPIPSTDPDGFQFPLEQIHAWADVDNDGDGLRDSVWFPMQADQFFPTDGVDNDLDGFVDETQDNALDDDGDGAADIDSDHALSASPEEIYRPIGANPVFDVDENIEGAPFVYHGLGPIDPETNLRTGDGLDNDGINGIDDIGEDKLFLTCPLPGLRIQIDLNNDGLLNEDDSVRSGANAFPVYVIVPEQILVATGIGPITLTANDVDALDNDFDGEINEVDAYAYVGPHTNAGLLGYPATGPFTRWEPFGNWGSVSSFYTNAHERGYIEINVDAYVREGAAITILPALPPDPGTTNGTNFLQEPNALRVTISGEPVCELVGRAAVHIADESAKINANVAHALTYRDQPASPGFDEGLLQRAMSSGSGPAEIDLRVLPGIGIALGQRITAARYGGPDGISISSNRAITDILDGGDPLTPFYLDVSLPGYGRVDDNANSLLLGLDRRNNNGDQYGGGFGLQDEGMYLPRLSALTANALVAGGFDTLTAAQQDQVLDELRATRFEEYYRRLGVFEGIDEPEEFRRFRGSRNFIAERNGVDNDSDGVVGEVGELGDAAFQSFDQILSRVEGIGTGIGARLRPVLGVHGTDRNVTFFDADDGLRALNRIDYNFAPAAQIAGQLLLTGDFTPVTDRAGVGFEQPQTPPPPALPIDHNTTGFAEGLRQADTGLRILDTTGAVDLDLPADPVLQTLLAAASIVDNRDTDHARTLLRTEDRDLIPGVVDNRRYLASFSNRPAFSAWPPSKEAIPVRDRIADDEIMPMEEIEEFLRTPLAIQDERSEITLARFNNTTLPNLVDNSANEDLRRLQSLDTWWANFVRADIRFDKRLTDAAIDGGSGLIPADAQIAEQRTISFAAAGAESIRINELMVRPVRRVEAEMVRFIPTGGTELSTGEVGPLYPGALDPMAALVDAGDVTATEIRLNALSPAPWDLTSAVQFPLPSFLMERGTSAEIQVTPPSGIPEIVATPGLWRLTGDYLRDSTTGILALGDTAGVTNVFDPLTGIAITDLATPISPLAFPNVLEFSFAGDASTLGENNGLPSGRYYLTLNIANADGTPSVGAVANTDPFEPFTDAVASRESNIYYTIKYVYDGPGNPAATDGYDAARRTIVEDLATFYQDALLTAPAEYEAYTETFWQPVPTEHFSKGGFGERAGWVFLDGTPSEFHQTEYRDFSGDRPGPYFAEMATEDASVLFQPAESDGLFPFPLYDFTTIPGEEPLVQYSDITLTPNVTLTHTVYVPPADSPWRLHVAVTSPEPIVVNFFDFSQEPDHEYIELTNISEEPVDLGGWELEIGIPEAVDPETGGILADPYASKWQVPAGTQIAPGGFLLLGFNKFDQFQTPRPLLGDVDGTGGGSYLENNGMGLARGGDVRDDLLPIIGDVTEPPIRGLNAVAPGDRFESLLFGTANTDGVASGQLVGGVTDADAFSDPTYSVFHRFDNTATAKDEYTDYIDNDGDGVSSAYLAALINTGANQTFNLDTDNSVADAQLASSFGDPSRPWDRIVALNCIQLGTAPIVLAGDPPVEFPYGGAPFTIADLNSVDDANLNRLARVILRGGVLPNYPEHDGIDNDGDGATVTNVQVASDAVVDLRYFPGALDTDLIDNDLDGFADLVQVAADLNGDGDIEVRAADAIAGTFAEFEFQDPFLSEGVDEGGNDLSFIPLLARRSLPPGVGQYLNTTTNELRGGRRYGAAGTFEAWPLPVNFFADRFLANVRFESVLGADALVDPITYLDSLIGTSSYLKLADGISNGTADDVTVAGHAPAFTLDLRPFVSPGFGDAYNEDLVAFLGDATDPDYGGLIKGPSSPRGVVVSGNAPYLGTVNDSPEWRAFVERRWNPGDNVIVSLYQGRATAGAVADRVTYREYDVINRTIDDGFASPYQALDLVASTAFPAGLNPEYPGMWAPDHMGLDFYRSLERKDPRYAGDRFGTRNRWDATDGNYDDWAESLSLANPGLALADNGSWTVSGLMTAGDSASWRFDVLDNFQAAKNRRAFGHALYGSPLRMNTATRVAQNPADLVALLDAETAGSRGPIAFDPIVGRPYTQFDSLDLFPLPGDGAIQRNLDWTQRKTVVANRPFNSIADLARVPMTTYEHVVASTGVSSTGGLGILFPQTPSNLRLAMGVWNNYRFDPSLRSGVMGFDESDAANSENILAQASANLATDSLTLTVGQAEFRPIRPDTSIIGGGLDWEPVATGQLPINAWTPVTLFSLETPGETFEYPAYPDGTPSGAVVDPFYLFNIDFLTNRAAAPFGDIFGLDALNALNNGTVNLTDIAARWPAAQRHVAYVARAPIGSSPDLRPQGIWSWDADDGLENGEYTLSVGTFMPGISNRLGGIQALLSGITGISQPGVNIEPYPETLLTGDGLDFLRMDPTNTNNTGTVFEPRFTFEIITEPTLAQGLAVRQADLPVGETQVQPGLTHPDDWFNTASAIDAVAQEPRSDGYILYGSSANGAWRPQRVKITKNFLAIRIRQEGEAGQCAIFTHVVLSPRKRTAGRINLNTAENRILDSGTDREFFNPLLGVPGVVDVLTTTRGALGGLLGVPLTDNDNFAPVGVPGTGAWPAPDNFTAWDDNGRTLHPVPPFVFQASPFGAANANTPLVDRLADSRPLNIDIPADEASALRIASMLLTGRTKHPDGRYYDNLGDLMRQSSTMARGNELSSTGRFWPRYNALPYNVDPFNGDYNPVVLGLRDFAAKESQRLSPLSNAPRNQDRFDEAIARLQRMSNSLTTRSDVFEIVVTVQSGYGVDANSDGLINYRTSEEFITTGEKAARMVYERRAPADRTDEPDLGVE